MNIYKKKGFTPLDRTKTKSYLTGFTPLDRAKSKSYLTGFTLIEMMIVLAIFLILMGAIFGMLTTGRRVWMGGSGVVRVQNEVKQGMNVILRELRLANPGVAFIDSEDADNNGRIDVAEVGNSPDSILFSIPLDTDGDGSPDLDVNNQLILGAYDQNGVAQSGWRIRFLRGGTGGNQLLRQITNANGNLQTETVVANDIGAIDFTNSIAPLELRFPEQVTVSITAEKTTLAGRLLDNPLRATLITRVALRN